MLRFKSPRFLLLMVLMTLGLLVFAARTIHATGNAVQVASVSSAGDIGDGRSGYWGEALSADGSTVVFSSDADNLVPNDTNNVGDIFVYERQTGQTSRVNVDSSGQQAAGFSSYSPSISADGRYVAFSTVASNLVANDTNQVSDVFVHDRQTGTTIRANVDSSGQLMSKSASPKISRDGRYIVFDSMTTMVVSGQTHFQWDTFVHDLQGGQTVQVSVGDTGQQANAASYLGLNSISADDRYIVFTSRASNLFASDGNGKLDVFLFDRQSGTSSLVSRGMNNQLSDGDSTEPSISSDGRYIAFTSTADNLVPDDTDGFGDIFVYDRQTGTTSRVSLRSDGGQLNAPSSDPVISADGHYVSFQAGDSDSAGNILVYNLLTGEIADVSEDPYDVSTWRLSYDPFISDDGQSIAFVADGNSQVPNLVSYHDNIFVAANPEFPDGVATPEPTPETTDEPTTEPTAAPTDRPNASPAPNYFTALPITLTWEHLVNAVSYEVQVDTSSRFTAPQTFTADGTLFVTINSLPDGVYYWRVRGHYANNTLSGWSSVQTFTLKTS